MTRYPEHTATITYHPLEKLVSADSHTHSSPTATGTDNSQVGKSDRGEHHIDPDQIETEASKRPNLRNTADRRSRANCTSGSATPTSTPSVLSPRSGEGDDHLMECPPTGKGVIDSERNGCLRESTSPKLDPKDGNRKSKRFSSKVKESTDSDGKGSEPGSNKLSQHFKFLMSLENDLGRGSKSTRASMIYAHENCPEKLYSEGEGCHGLAMETSMTCMYYEILNDQLG